MWSASEIRRALGALLLLAWGGHGAVALGQMGADFAVPAADPRIVAWASGVSSLVRGPQAIFDASYGNATFGSAANALGPADVTITDQQQNTFSVVSLGDGGSITLTFDQPIRNGFGPDLAVFENSFSANFLELAFVEVSSDGVHFTRFPSISLTPTDGIVEDLNKDDFSLLDPANLYDLAGKYRGGLGTPFDLAELAGTAGLDINHIVAVRIEDVVGSVNPLYARYDSQGHIIKDPFPTVFPSGGFDLDAVAVLYTVPEPSVAALLFGAGVVLLGRRRRGNAAGRWGKAAPCGAGEDSKGIRARELGQRNGGKGMGAMEWGQRNGGKGMGARERGAREWGEGNGGEGRIWGYSFGSIPLPSRRSAGAGRRVASGFTLVELLVVMAILAILFALVSGSVMQSRERAEVTECASNLRQLAGANAAYAADHDGSFVPAQEPTNTIRWHGVRDGVGAKFDGARGPLSPYLGHEGRVKICPTLRRVLTGGSSFESGTGGYGYNAAYIGGSVDDPWTPARMGALTQPVRTVMFADTAFARANGVQEYAYAEPWQTERPAGRFRNPLSASVHFRHGGLANVAWCDGHVTQELPTKIDGTNLYGGDGGKWSLGWFGPSEKNGYWRPWGD